MGTSFEKLKAICIIVLKNIYNMYRKNGKKKLKEGTKTVWVQFQPWKLYVGTRPFTDILPLFSIGETKLLLEMMTKPTLQFLYSQN